jgi:hypothetical protein
MKGPKQKGDISLEIVAYWFCMKRVLFILIFRGVYYARFKLIGPYVQCINLQ